MDIHNDTNETVKNEALSEQEKQKTVAMQELEKKKKEENEKVERTMSLLFLLIVVLFSLLVLGPLFFQEVASSTSIEIKQSSMLPGLLLLLNFGWSRPSSNCDSSELPSSGKQLPKRVGYGKKPRNLRTASIHRVNAVQTKGRRIGKGKRR